MKRPNTRLKILLLTGIMLLATVAFFGVSLDGRPDTHDHTPSEQHEEASATEHDGHHITVTVHPNERTV